MIVMHKPTEIIIDKNKSTNIYSNFIRVALLKSSKKLIHILIDNFLVIIKYNILKYTKTY